MSGTGLLYPRTGAEGEGERWARGPDCIFSPLDLAGGALVLNRPLAGVRWGMAQEPKFEWDTSWLQVGEREWENPYGIQLTRGPGGWQARVSGRAWGKGWGEAEQALRDLLGPPLLFQGVECYSMEPSGGPRQLYCSPYLYLACLGPLEEGPNGWRFFLVTDKWSGSPDEAARDCREPFCGREWKAVCSFKGEIQLVTQDPIWEAPIQLQRLGDGTWQASCGDLVSIGATREEALAGIP